MPSSAKLLGLEFNESGVAFQPNLPLAEYEFTSPLLGFKKSADGYSGWYAPAKAGSWEIEMKLSESERRRKLQLQVNGVAKQATCLKHGIRFRGESKPGEPLRWEVL